MEFPPRLPQAVAVFLTVTIVLPLVTAGTALGAILFLPLPTPALPEPKPGIDSRVTHILAADGSEIGILRKFETSIPVKPADIPQVLKQAVVAEEDQRFYSHSGVDIKGAVRAFWADLTGGKTLQGGSTITQQYVKNAYTTGQRTLARKLREALLANKLERKLSKDEILYRYLDNIYLGGGAYGVGAAAQSYFNKPVSQVTLSESAMLAGLIASPSVDEPRSNPVRAEQKREAVLRKMLDQHLITDAQYSEALPQRVFLVGSGPAPDGPATLVQPLELQSATYPYFVDAVRRYLIARFGDDVVYRGGLRVETSLDVKMQAQAEASVKDSLSGTDPPLEMALVSTDPTTGLVKAIVGGRDFAASQVNLALGNCPVTAKAPPPDAPVCLSGGGTGRQPGSSFKPYTLAAAFEKGIGPDAVYSGPSSYTFPGCSGTGCTVHNVESEAVGSITLRGATQLSVNTVFAQLIGNVGIQRTAEMAHRLGVTMIDPNGRQPNGEPYGSSLTLGAAEVSPYDMAAAFGVFANHGLQLAATPVAKVFDADGRVLEDNTKRKGKQVIAPEIADNVTDVLKGVISAGTGTAADIGRPDAEAGKTGTAENFGDAWFVGYTPVLSTAVWMGYADRPRPLTGIKGVGKVYGGTIPAKTWHNFMSQALAGVDYPDFPPPAPLNLVGDFAPGAQREPVSTPPGGPFVVVGPPLPPTPPTSIPTVTLPGASGPGLGAPTTSTTSLLNLFPPPH
ncbi:MAG: penicillin-binding protein [Actinomycetota bacterium]|nr:penicillin-binding protein [Actinomycetota bacterium]